MSTPKTIAILLPDLRTGGAERMHLLLADSWLRRGFKIDLILLQRRGGLIPLIPAGVRVIDLGVNRLRSVVFPLVRYLRSEKPAALLAAMWPLTLIAIMAKFFASDRLRVIVSDHNTLSLAYSARGKLHRLLLRLSMGLIYRMADARIAVSRGVAQDLSNLSRIPKYQFTVIYNPTALGSPRATTVKRGNANADKSGPLILSVGALKEQKDHALLIEAFSRLPGSLGARLCILGEGELRTALEQLVRVKGLQEFVTLPGFMLDPYPFYESADLFVLSSRYEGFGNVIVEALDCGIPVVSTDCPSGPREILSDGKYGYLTPVGDLTALAQTIQKALSDKPDRQLLRSRANEFTVEKIAKQYLGVLLPSPKKRLRS